MAAYSDKKLSRMPERAARKIAYVNRDELAHNIQNRRENSPYNTEDSK